MVTFSYTVSLLSDMCTDTSFYNSVKVEYKFKF